MKKLIMILLALLASTQIHAVTMESDILWFSSDEYWDFRNIRGNTLSNIITIGMDGRQVLNAIGSDFPELGHVMGGYYSDGYVVIKIHDELVFDTRGPDYRWGIQFTSKTLI